MPRAFLVCASLLAAPAAHAAGDVEYGEYLSSQCVTCHQASGADKGIPPILGWDEEAFAAVMQSYKTKEREHPVMRMIAGGLDAEQIEALAAYFATFDPEEAQ